MIVNFIQDLIHYEFLQKALITAILVGLISGTIGSFVILRGMALMGDAISHAILPGVVLSYILGFNYFIGAVLTGILSSFLIGNLTQNTKLKADVSIGVVFSSLFALGILLLLKAQTAIDLTSILFGNVLTVKDTDLYITLGVGIFVIVVVFIFYKEFLITSFDPVVAQSFGLNVKFYHQLMMLLLTLVTVASLQTVGVILVVSMLITPAATAYLLTKRLHHMIFLASTLGMFASVLGLMLSFQYNLSTGAMIVLVLTGFFILAYLFSPDSGVLIKPFRKRVNP